MGETGIYPPWSLALLHEKQKNGTKLNEEEKSALELPYPELPPDIRDFKSRQPSAFQSSLVGTFALEKIANYRDLFTLSKLLSQGVSKSTLSGFGNTPEESAYQHYRRMGKIATFGYWATAVSAVIGFNVICTVPLWFKTFGIVRVLIGNAAMYIGAKGLWYPALDFYRTKEIVTGAGIAKARREELLRLKQDGVISYEFPYKEVEFPPNPFYLQEIEELKKREVWTQARAKKG